VSAQPSYALLVHFKTIAQPFIKKAAPILYISGSQIQLLTPNVLFVSLKKMSTWGLESGGLLVYSHNYPFIHILNVTNNNRVIILL